LLNQSFSKSVSKVLTERSIRKIVRLKDILASNYLLPSTLCVEPTTKCNLRCGTCLRPRGPGEINADMQFELFRSIVDQFKPLRRNSRMIDLTGLGEPLLNPKLVPMIRYAKKNNLRVNFVSNFTSVNKGNMIDLIEAQFDYLCVSIDGASKQTFEKVKCGADFDKVTENVKLFAETKKDLNSTKPKLTIVSTISEDNLQEVPQLIRLAEILAVDEIAFLIRYGRMYKSPKNESEEGYFLNGLFISPNWNDLTAGGVEVYVDDLKSSSCCATQQSYITYDGRVLPCYYLIQIMPREQYSRFQFGNLKNSSLVDVWFSARYKQFRTNIALGNYPPICREYCPLAR
jgi:MoaA/NifB/PqqE/SkfB family radical SAM enzyme